MIAYPRDPDGAQPSQRDGLIAFGSNPGPASKPGPRPGSGSGPAA